MDIEIQQPISLRLEVVETDDHVPSMLVSAQIVVSQFQHACRYEGTFWIECTSWSDFTDSLRAPSWRDAVLRDISGYFILALRKTDEEVLLVWEFEKADVGSDRQMKMSFSSRIDDDMLGQIRRQFLDFPAWW